MSSARRASWNPERTAVRHGHEDGEVTLGGRRVEVAAAAGADRGRRAPRCRWRPMSISLIVIRCARVVLERMLAGVSTRRYRRTQEPVGEEVEARARSTSKSAVSRTFVERTREALGELMSRQLGGSAPGGDDARRAGAEGPDDDRRAGDHDARA